MNRTEFLAKHGFPGTPPGDRMKADLDEILATHDRRRGTGGNQFLPPDATIPDVVLEISKGINRLKEWVEDDPDRYLDLGEITVTTKRIPSGAISVEVAADLQEVHVIKNATLMYISLDKEPGPGGGYIEKVTPNDD